MDKDLDRMIEQATNRELELQKKGDELALQSKEFASYLAEKKRLDEELEVLWDYVREYMLENNIKEHENDYISLKLTPTGRYKTANIDNVTEEVCQVKKVLDNKKVKAYLELNGKLPDGVESCGYALRKKLKTKDGD